MVLRRGRGSEDVSTDLLSVSVLKRPSLSTSLPSLSALSRPLFSCLRSRSNRTQNHNVRVPKLVANHSDHFGAFSDVAVRGSPGFGGS